MTYDYQKRIDQVVQDYKTNEQQGLSDHDVKERLQINGLNILPEKKGPSASFIFLMQFSGPLMIALIIAMIISLTIGRLNDALVIAITALISAIVGFFQEWKAERASQLLKSFEVFECMVRRDGQAQTIQSRFLVPGDVVMLASGMKVPADIRLTSGHGLEIDESLLTGESVPVKKQVLALTGQIGLGEQTNMLFSGTYVVEGLGEGIVVATGVHTQLGAMAQLLGQTEHPLTPLQEHVSHLGTRIGIFFIAIAMIFALIEFYKGETMYDILITSIALAIAALPEGLPIAITSMLALGMRRMLAKNALVRHLFAAETLGGVSVICTDKTGTLTEGKMLVSRLMTVDGQYDLEKEKRLAGSAHELITCGMLGIGSQTHSLTDGALVSLAKHFNISGADFSLIGQVPFSSVKKVSATHLIDKNKKELIILKGAPEAVFQLCKNDITPFQVCVEQWAKEGLRVIALARRQGENLLLQENMKEFICIGLFGLQDQLRETARNTIAQLQSAGIHLVLITGDHPETAHNIAQKVGIGGDNQVIDGSMLDSMTDDQLDQLVLKQVTFARVDPKHKIRIVQACRDHGHSVAMIGDGVNDAPALKAADIGVALGSGVDVVKEVADIVLLDNNLATIVEAVKEGRVIFDNIQKVLLHLFAHGFAEMLLITSGVVFGLPLPLLPAQIFGVKLITDTFPYLALTFEPGDTDIMKRRPRSNKDPLLNKDMMILFFIGSLVIAGGLILFYSILLSRGVDLARARTMLSTNVVFDVVLYALSVRTLNRSMFTESILSNLWMIGAIVMSFLLQFAVIYTPFLQTFFMTVPLSFNEVLLVVALSIAKILLIDSLKVFFLTSK